MTTRRTPTQMAQDALDTAQRKVERADLLKAASEATDFAAYLASLPPKGDYPGLQKALAIWSDHAPVHDNIGLALRRSGRPSPP